MSRTTIYLVIGLAALALGAWLASGWVADPVRVATPNGGTAASQEAGSGRAGGSTAGTRGVPAPAPSPVAVPVEAEPATRGDLVKRISATGTAEAARQVRIVARVGGTLERLPVREGQLVEKEEPLAALDDTELILERERAREQVTAALAGLMEQRLFTGDARIGGGALRGNLRSEGDGEGDGDRRDEADPGGAEDPDSEDDPGSRDASGSATDSESDAGPGGEVAPANLAEYRDAEPDFILETISVPAFRRLLSDPRLDVLFREISRDEVVAARLGLVSARVELERAELNLERATIGAPFGGQVAELDVVEGQQVDAGTGLLTLVDADPVRVRVEVIESEISMVEEGRRAEVSFAAYPNDPVTGRVEAISPLVDPDSRTLEVVVRLPNPDRRFKPGMFATVDLDARIFRDRLLVPSSALLIRDDRPLVFVVEADRARWVHVETGLENPDYVEILDGVEPGDLVITTGHFSLAHDSPVRVVEDAEQDGEE